MKWFLAIILVLWALPQTLPAGSVIKDAKLDATWKVLNDSVNGKTHEIRYLAFGPIMKIIGTLGFVYGMIMAYMTGTWTKLAFYGGLGIMIGILPNIIDTVVGCTLP